MNLRPIATLITMLSLTLPASVSSAAGPTTAQCLDASDASIDLANQHRLIAERAQLLTCAAASCPSDVRKECQRRVDEVAAQVPTVVFLARTAAGDEVTNVKVTMDGRPLADRLDGTSIAIDPGEHAFTFEAPGQPPARETTVIVEGQKDRRERITFPSAHAAPAGSSAAVEGAPGLGPRKIVALITGGIGVVGLGVGTVLGVMAASQKSDAQSACPGASCASQDGVNKWNDATTTGNLSTFAFVVGGAGIAAATVLWLSAPPSGERPSAAVGLGLGRVQVEGSW